MILIRVVRHLFNEGMPIRQLTELGIFLRKNRQRIDFQDVEKWIKRLRLTQMTQLSGEFLIQLFGFTEESLLGEEPLPQAASETHSPARATFFPKRIRFSRAFSK
jgi:hypothetical protein